jgi:hypothetical protein
LALVPPTAVNKITKLPSSYDKHSMKYFKYLLPAAQKWSGLEVTASNKLLQMKVVLKSITQPKQSTPWQGQQ